jgi:hypothetical protein
MRCKLSLPIFIPSLEVFNRKPFLVARQLSVFIIKNSHSAKATGSNGLDAGSRGIIVSVLVGAVSGTDNQGAVKAELLWDLEPPLVRNDEAGRASPSEMPRSEKCRPSSRTRRGKTY